MPRGFVRSNRSGISFDSIERIHRRARGHITAIRTWIHASTELGHHGLDSRARLGPVKALASLDPLRGLAALTGRSVEPGNGNYVMARESGVEAMDEITSPDVDQDTIDRCRELLGDDGVDLSDDDVDRVRQHADVVARVVIELFLNNRETH